MKAIYEIPTVNVVEIKVQGMLCDSNKSMQQITWFMSATDGFNSGAAEWGRSGYGDSIGF